MKEIEILSKVEAIKVHDTMGLYYKKESGDLYSFHKNELVARNVCDFNFTDNDLVYTQSELGDLFIVMNDGREKILTGFFYLSFFKKSLQHYAVIKNDSPDDLANKVVLVDQSFEIQKTFKPFKASIDGYFATGKTKEITVFNEEQKEVWRRELKEIDASLSSNDSLTSTFYEAHPKTLVVHLESGRLLGLDISNGELRWKQDQVGKMAFFKNKIYCVASYTENLSILKTINIMTGLIDQSVEIKNLKSNYGFWFTGKIKVYEEHIFAASAGRPGLIAVFDRKSLAFKEMINLEESIPNDADHLHWHDMKLYVLDFGKTLHIYEED